MCASATIATPILASTSAYIYIYIACINSATAAVSNPNIWLALPVGLPPATRWSMWFYLDMGDAVTSCFRELMYRTAWWKWVLCPRVSSSCIINDLISIASEHPIAVSALNHSAIDALFFHLYSHPKRIAPLVFSFLVPPLRLLKIRFPFLIGSVLP